MHHVVYATRDDASPEVFYYIEGLYGVESTLSPSWRNLAGGLQSRGILGFDVQAVTVDSVEVVEKPKLLMLARFLPYPEYMGGRIRAAAFLEHLSTRFSITLVTFLDVEQSLADVQALQTHCARIEVVSFSRSKARLFYCAIRSLFLWQPLRIARFWSLEVSRILDRLDLAEFALIQVEELAMMQYLHPPMPSKIVLNQYNVEAQLVRGYARIENRITRRLFAGLEFWKLKRFERRAISQADVCLTVSDDDREAFLEQVPEGRFVVAPNGVDLEYFAPLPDSPSEPSLVFVGTMSWLPNVDAVEYFVDEIWPLVVQVHPNLVFHIVGTQPSDSVRRLAQDPNILVTGTVKDVRPYLHANSIGVVPLRIGSGTRLKVLQSLAMGQVVVSSSLGCEGLGVRAGIEVAIADEPRAFAAWINILLKDTTLRRSMIANGLRFVRQHYSWHHILGNLDAVYRGLLNSEW